MSSDIQLALFGDAVPAPGHESSARGAHACGQTARLVITARARERFWSNVVKGPGNECWIWSGAISSPDGYGRFTWQERGQRRTMSAHRFALLAALGRELEGGLVGEHGCCEPLCVRVGTGHLHVAEQSENIAYAVARGRHLGNREVVGSRDRHARSVRVRAAVADGWCAQRLAAARGEKKVPETMPLW